MVKSPATPPAYIPGFRGPILSSYAAVDRRFTTAVHLLCRGSEPLEFAGARVAGRYSAQTVVGSVISREDWV